MLDSTQINVADKNNQYNFAYLIDVSDSMSGNPLQQAKNAYNTLTQSLIDKGIADVSQFAVIPFGTEASLYAPLNATDVISTVEGLSNNGLTNFNAALEKANEFFSTASPGATNIVLFLSDGFSNKGGSFKKTAEALQAVADVQAYGFGAANIIDLRIVDSDQKPVIVSEASDLGIEFTDSIDNFIARNPQDIDSQTDGDGNIEIASPAPNEVVEDNSLDSSNDQIFQGDEENLVDDSVAQNPDISPKPEVDNIIKLGSSVDGLIGGEFPILSVEDISIEEGDIGTSIAQFGLNLSSSATEEVKFSYQTVDGSAIYGSDFNQTSGQITIPVGESRANIDVEVKGDSEVELNEKFTLNLFELSGATFENNKAEYSSVATIENDDVDDVAQSSPIVPQDATQNTQIPDDGNIFDGNLLNLESFAGDVTISFTVEREAEFDNTVGFYQIENAQGTITDPITGNTLNPSDGKAYAELAIRLHEPQLQLSVDNLSPTIIEDTLSGGFLYAPFIVADGDIETLEGDFSKVYFSFVSANSDGVEHIRSLGDNSLGFEDLFDGGDRDFDDISIRAQIASV
jgi:hypothetical protein